VSRSVLGSTQPPIQWVPGVKRGQGVTLTTHPHLVPTSRMRCVGTIPPLPPSNFVACSGTALVIFNDTFSVIHTIHSVEWNGDKWITKCKGCERKRPWPNFKTLPRHSLEGLSKSTKNLSRECQSPEPPDYEVGVLTTRPQRSIYYIEKYRLCVFLLVNRNFLNTL
jgi:hypothetical protein